MRASREIEDRQRDIKARTLIRGVRIRSMHPPTASRSPNGAVSGNANSAKTFAPFRRSLLKWYDEHRRDLPWRQTRDPYRIWLSEIMLQQTRVAAVLEHYRLFLERFPDVHALAAASEDSVLAAWSGLGYYRRARMLHQCAKEIVQRHGGSFPQSAELLLQLPGIGRYTAAAIASIAFSEPVAVVDGNVERVLRRLSGMELTKEQNWFQAQAMLAPSRPSDFNQAMMELGATVCVPREPRCLMCPIRKSCVTQGELPRETPASPQKKRQIWCALQCSGVDGGTNAKVRLVQRSRKDSLMPGMWELPNSLEPPRETASLAHWRTFRHSITVTDYTVHVLRGAPARDEAFPDPAVAARARWMAIDRIPHIPLTGLTRKILRASGLI
jgi:A/G-specific adenine glycosylase